MKRGHVAVGGTFDKFHSGHEALIKKAVEIGGFVTLGITTDRFSGKVVEPFETRRKAVVDFLKSLGWDKYEIVILEDPYGPAASDDALDSLVVSEETYGRAVELNQIRRKSGLDALKIINIAMLPAADGGPLSSSRIRKGEIDRAGKSA